MSEGLKAVMPTLEKVFESNLEAMVVERRMGQKTGTSINIFSSEDGHVLSFHKIKISPKCKVADSKYY